MREDIKSIYQGAMAVKSFTNSAMEKDIEKFLNNEISKLEYFKNNKDNYGLYKLPNDFHKRDVNWAFVNKKAEDTVVIYHHHDTVNTEDYGNAKDIALDGEKLNEYYLHGDDEDLSKDIEGDKWLLGRGSCDMKGSLALQFGVLKAYSESNSGEVNLLFLSVPDEEAYSAGMRGAIELLYDLKEKFGLKYSLAIDSEPFESDDEEAKTLHIGTVGKLMPVLVAQGVISHMKEPLKGISAISLMSRIATNIDLNPRFSEEVRGASSPLPTWNYMKDRKDVYDVSSVYRCAGYFSLLHLDKSPKELMNTLKEIVSYAVSDFYNEFKSLQEKYGERENIKEPQVLFYNDIVDMCKKKDGFHEFLLAINKEAEEDFSKGKNYQDITIEKIEKVLDFYGKKESIVVISIAPPYNPAMSIRNLKDVSISYEKLIAHYKEYLSDRGLKLTTEEFFMGICDNSYCAIEKPVLDYLDIMDSMAVSKDQYNIDFEKLNEISMMAVNLGPWGKKLHQCGERVYKEDILTNIPEYILYLLENFNEIKL